MMLIPEPNSSNSSCGAFLKVGVRTNLFLRMRVAAHAKHG